MRRAADTSREGWLYASAAYAALLAWTALAPLPARQLPRPATRVRLVAPAPPPRADAAPPPEAPPPPPRKPPRRMEVSRRPASEPLAPLVASAPPPSAPAPRRFTVSMEATVPGGGVAVPVTSPGRAANPRGVPGAALEGPTEGSAPALEPDRGPSLLSQPGAAEMRALYPESARRAGIEGDVRLELVVSEDGEVLEVKVVRPAGNGLDEVAERLVRRFRFRPATSGGRPVSARIPWTYRFRLEG